MNKKSFLWGSIFLGIFLYGNGGEKTQSSINEAI